ncbi:MAG: porin [Sutterella sp.]|nr:porin [Sutterella sp.]
MKKQILACAVTAAFATGAVAAEVTIYGDVNTGVVYNYTKVGDNASTNSFTMESGISGASRWGVKGGEDLGNGYSVSFDLQSGFDSDTGKMKYDRLFGREVRLTVAGPFGEVSFGRMGTMTSSAGTYDIFQGTADLFDGGWTSAIAGSNFFYDVTRADNMVTYATPTMAGVKGYVQYSFKVDNGAEGTEGKNSSKRYAGVGLTYENGPLSLVAVYDSVLNPTADPDAKKDGRAFSFGGNYDFGAAKLYAAYQYGKSQNFAGGVDTNKKHTQVKGHNFGLGVAVPVGVGTVNFAGYYTTAKSENISDNTVKTYNVAATYTYPFSKRTSVYAGIGYLQIKDKLTGISEKTKSFDAAIGLAHSF